MFCTTKEDVTGGGHIAGIEPAAKATLTVVLRSAEWGGRALSLGGSAPLVV